MFHAKFWLKQFKPDSECQILKAPLEQ